MIPVSLQLRDFLSYGADVPTLDFTRFDVACISGKNGHGKSALFDAITWALWGEARKGSGARKADEGLVRAGAAETGVAFVFDLHGRRYRVERRFRCRRSGGVASLEFQVYDPDTACYRTLSEAGSVRRTQACIDALLRMSYETFVNSALLLQGQADAFTRRTPAERKTVLTDILDLSRYADYEQAARARAGAAHQDIERAERRLEEIAASEARAVELADEIEAAERTLKHRDEAVRVAEARWAEARERATRIDALQSELSRARADRQRIGKELEEAGKQMAAALAQRKAAGALIDQEHELRAQREARDALRERLDRERSRAATHAEYLSARDAIRSRIERARLEADHRVEAADNAVTRAQEAVDGLESVLTSETDIVARSRRRDDLRAQEKELVAAAAKRDRLIARLATLDAQLSAARADCDARIEMERRAVDTLKREIIVLDDIASERDALARKQKTRQQLQMDRTALADRDNQLQLEAQILERRVSEAQSARSRIQRQIQDLREDTGDCPVCGSELDADHREEVRGRLTRDDADLAVELADIQTSREAICGNRQRLQTEREEVDRRAAALDGLDGELADLRARSVRADAARAECAEAEARLEESVRRRADLDRSASAQEADGLRADIDAIGYDPDAHQDLREALLAQDGLTADIRELDRAKARIQEARETLSRAETDRERAIRDTAEIPDAETRAERDRLNARIRRLAYDRETTKLIESDLEDLAGLDARLDAFAEARRTQAEANARIDAIEDQRARREPDLAALDERMCELEADLEEQAPAPDLEGLDTEVTAERRRRDEALARLAERKKEHELCARDLAERPSIESHRNEARRQNRIHAHLVKAFGRDGIPARLIEQAIPEIEEEANELLDRLTDDRTRVRLESLRDLKNGSARETLDIHISDSRGERPYELFSGGEAFRVDFALRVALSKLLARRAGAPLQTLVIDEGFGSQDAEGVDRLIHAIQAIRPEFEKILVITHVEAVKQAFPVTVAVEKSAERGSTFRVVA